MRRVIDKERLAQELAGLSDLPYDVLKAKWLDLFGFNVPAKLGRAFMIQAIGYRMQEKAFGGLRPAVARRLDQYADRDRDRPTRSMKLKPGTRLLREWQGKTHEVIILDKGVLYGGERYRSLTEVAENITGVGWSGPRFFGLTSKAVSANG